MKDFHDMVNLIQTPGILKDDFTKDAIHKTFLNRCTPLAKIPLNFNDDEIETLKQYWRAHCRTVAPKGRQLEENFSAVVEFINQYLIKIGF